MTLTFSTTFTVFTPTFNRAHTLTRVYTSLCEQEFKDFEWLIVDDGSTDDTAGLITKWQAANLICIRYFQQANGGKHRAFNYGVALANGQLFLPFDSDDSCCHSTLRSLLATWTEIPENIRETYSGISCLCRNENGEILGGPLPEPTIDGHPREVLENLNRTSEMWGFHRTDILRAHPFPTYPGEPFVPEGLVWNRIGQKYKIRFIDRALRIYHQSPDGLTSKMAEIRHKSPHASALYYSELCQMQQGFRKRLRAAANYWRFSTIKSLKVIRPRDLPVLFSTLGLAPGLAAKCLDALRS